jgi:hypothetical protein
MLLIVQEAVMAIGRNAKAKARRKRNKASITKTARSTGKKTVNKASPRPASTKQAKPPAKTVGKTTPVGERAPEAGRPSASRAGQPASSEQRIGVVTHYYGYLPVAAMRLEPGSTLRVGDVIHIRGHSTDFTQKIELLEVNRAPVTEVGPNDNFGVKVVKHVFEHDVVFKVRP